MKARVTSIFLIVLLLGGIKNASAQCTTVLYRDADGDGLGDPNNSITSCYSRSGYVSNNNDCDDNNHSAGLIKTWYEDFDGDGYGNPNVSVSSCTQPPGYVEIGIDEYDSISQFLFITDERYTHRFDYPYRSAVVTHYADCNLNEDDTIKISQSPITVQIYNEQGVLSSEAGFLTGLPNPYFVAVHPGYHAKITYYFASHTTDPLQVDITYIEYYDDFYFEKCTTVSGPQSVCEGTSTTLTAQKDTESVFNWYDAQTGGNLLYTGNVFQTPNLKSGLYTYWVSADGGPRRSYSVSSIGPVIHNPGDTTVAANANTCTATVNFKNPYATEPCTGTGIVVFHGTGAYQTWVVPQNVYSVDVDAVGAPPGPYSVAKPGRVRTTLAVTPGETLYINVANGSYPNGGMGASEAGPNGTGSYAHVSGESGGGSTQVGRTGTLLTDTLIVAGGGGGNGYDYFQGTDPGSPPGNGGYVANANPGDPNFMHGMDALPDQDITDLHVSGGGGGGYFGGLTGVLPGDGYSPGQGGSSHVAATGTSNTIFTQGFTGNNSYVQLTYAPGLPMTQTAGLPSGSQFPIGTTPVSFKYTNSNGVEKSCSFNVTVTGSLQTWYLDADNDGHYVSSLSSCTSPGTNYNTTATQSGDCNDNDNTKWQSALLYVDADGDGYTVGAATLICYGTAIPAGYVASSLGSDCDDTKALVHATQTWYLDADNDGHYLSSQVSCGSPGSGYNTTATISGDCNDNDNTKWQSASLYVDADGDGYTVGAATSVCYGATIPKGYSSLSLGNDCKDQNAAVHPGAVEICGNGIDDNCNGLVDENCTCGNATVLTTTNITTTSATLNWVANVNPLQWQVQYESTARNSKWIDVTGITPSMRSVTISGLTLNQSYTWHIRAKCSKSWTSYSNATGFKTLSSMQSTPIVQARPLEESVNVEETNSRLTLYPNPSNGRFIINLHLSNNNSTKAKIELVSMLGQTVYTDNGSIANGKLQQTVSMPSLAAHGMYLVRVITNNKVYEQKLIYTK